METGRMKLALSAGMLAVSLALAGCGGGGGSGATPPGQTPTQLAQTAATEITEANAAIEAAEDGTGTLAAAQTAYDEAVSAVNAASTAGAANTNALNRDLGAARQELDRVRTALNAGTTPTQMEMRDTARKLHAGISAPQGALGGTSANDRAAGYVVAAGTPSGSKVGDIRVTFSDGTTNIDVALSEDKDTTVADNHGWEGKRYHRTTPASGGTYEAYVYSNVEDPKQGRMFGSAAAVTTTGAFEYMLTSGVFTVPDSSGNTTAVQKRIALTGIDRTAGTETFKFPTDNPANAQLILVPGSYHGVSGTFRCAPTNDTVGCTAAVAETGGFTLADGTWTFRPGDPNARVTDAEDTAYASFGWWLHKSEDGKTYTASAFVDERGMVANASGLDALNGTATYMGGAAGKYALYSTTGGTNDAGHFTARATLTANFSNNTMPTAITGTIDEFIGADGESRDWSVKLNGSTIGDTGLIGDSSGGTEWTIGGNAADDSGQWTGNLRNNGDDGVPKVATGTFYSEYGTAGKMVGGFGATKQ